MIITYKKNDEKLTKIILNQTDGIKCTVCKKEFRSISQLRAHNNMHHKIFSDNRERKIIRKPVKKAENIKCHNVEESLSKQFDCYVCSERWGKFVASN